MVSCIEPNGRIPSRYDYEVPEPIHMYVLPALAEASRILGKPQYGEAALKALGYYRTLPNVLNDAILTHFLAYILDGFIEMGEREFVAGVVRKLFASQRRNGSIPAMPHARWTCTVGVAQLAIIAYKLDMRDAADRAVNYLCHVQNHSGGFPGSVGWGAEYFRNEEISWAAKFFLDAVHLKKRSFPDYQAVGSPLPPRVNTMAHEDEPCSTCRSSAHEDTRHPTGVPYDLDRTGHGGRRSAEPCRQAAHEKGIGHSQTPVSERGTRPSERHILSSHEWASSIIAPESVDQLAWNIRHNLFPVWCKPLLQNTLPGDTVLELGSGTGQLSAILALHGRTALLVDSCEESLAFAKQLFDKLGLQGQFRNADILKGIPAEDGSVDWVFSSGLLEHFTNAQIGDIMADCVRVCKKGVMSLLPNANSIFYRAGKSKLEREGRWPYGRETPVFTMTDHYEKAGLRDTKEWSVGTYHALRFYDDDGCIREFLDGLSISDLRRLNQGYLLFTCGRK